MEIPMWRWLLIGAILIWHDKGAVAEQRYAYSQLFKSNTKNTNRRLNAQRRASVCVSVLCARLNELLVFDAPLLDRDLTANLHMHLHVGKAEISGLLISPSSVLVELQMNCLRIHDLDCQRLL